MEKIELQPGQKVYLESEIEELFKQRDEALRRLEVANAKISDQRVLINQSVKVVQHVQKLMPGLFNGAGINAMNIPNIISSVMGNSQMSDDFITLKKLMDEYQSKNAVPLRKDQ